MRRIQASRLWSSRIVHRCPSSYGHALLFANSAQYRLRPVVPLVARCRLFSSSPAADEPASDGIAAKGLRVKVNMKMATPDGTVLDETPDVDFVCGVGQMLVGVDRAIEGMRVGETRQVTLDAADAFGEKDENIIIEVPLAELPANSKKGDPLSTPDGGRAVIVAIQGDNATVDHNHILAGRTVVFTATLLEVSDIPTLSCEVVNPGDGVNFPKKGDTLTMHYTGTLAATGIVFDTSRGDGRQPFKFTIGVGEVIKGWDAGLTHMSLGERSILEIPSEMAYGEKGTDVIPPNADLHFDVELLKIN